VDGKYWFPTYARSDETLHLKDQDVSVRMVIKWTDFKLLSGGGGTSNSGASAPSAGTTSTAPANAAPATAAPVGTAAPSKPPR